MSFHEFTFSNAKSIFWEIMHMVDSVKGAVDYLQV